MSVDDIAAVALDSKSNAEDCLPNSCKTIQRTNMYQPG
jgi:hypothetical protein